MHQSLIYVTLSVESLWQSSILDSCYFIVISHTFSWISSQFVVNLLIDSLWHSSWWRLMGVVTFVSERPRQASVREQINYVNIQLLALMMHFFYGSKYRHTAPFYGKQQLSKLTTGLGSACSNAGCKPWMIRQFVACRCLSPPVVWQLWRWPIGTAKQIDCSSWDFAPAMAVRASADPRSDQYATPISGNALPSLSHCKLLQWHPGSNWALCSGSVELWKACLISIVRISIQSISCKQGWARCSTVLKIIALSLKTSTDRSEIEITK